MPESNIISLRLVLPLPSTSLPLDIPLDYSTEKCLDILAYASGLGILVQQLRYTPKVTRLGMDPSAQVAGPAITLSPMVQQLEVRKEGDDWTGVTSTAERRKLQNRLNKRASRRRKRNFDIALANYTSVSNTVQAGDFGIKGSKRGLTDDAAKYFRLAKRYQCTMDDPARRARLTYFASQAYSDYAGGKPQPVQLPTLVKLNVFNALARNATALGLMTTEWVLCDAISPFGRSGPLVSSYELSGGKTCPPSLRPTSLQLTVPHRPWIDLFPLPRLRDNLLLAMKTSKAFDELGLCFDMVEAYGTTTCGPDDPLLLVWGEPWNPYSWEASVAFLRKWGWLLRGCREILESTNHWREKRGEQRLSFDGLIC